MKRRMRNRTYGVVRGGWGDPTPYSIFSLLRWRKLSGGLVRRFCCCQCLQVGARQLFSALCRSLQGGFEDATGPGAASHGVNGRSNFLCHSHLQNHGHGLEADGTTPDGLLSRRPGAPALNGPACSFFFFVIWHAQFLYQEGKKTTCRDRVYVRGT